MGFSQAISGLNAASSNLDVIGNNIANSETTGFKSASVSFADIFASSQVGLGVKVASVSQDFGDGTVESTERGLDVAISGTGFFRVTDENGSVYYSRNGEFSRDDEYNLVNSSGYYLTGYAATGTPPTINTGAEPTVINIPPNNIAAQQTTSSTMSLNLNSSDSAVTAAFDETNVNTYNFSRTLTTYDSQGNTHNVNLYFTKTLDNTWKVYGIDSSDSSAITHDLGTLTFDSSGNLTGTASLTVDTNGINGSANNSFTIDFTGTTQQSASQSTINSATQDGYASGSLSSYTINNDGTITGTYSNGQTQLLGQIVMASFANPQGLKSEGDNVWTSTASSGAAIVGTAGVGVFGSLTSGALESSNVDIGSELVNMIVAQRNYQSNAQTIKTQDSILNTLVNLR
ncbi:flagellar hook protein FlgE [Brenneria goodwinii]|uniref:flagellar hook protein FlgE n=1 Tax=Brenneria goodwinii TaxID=1109412 RepID=UPI000EF22D2B|nr:flagellar hook protein FlgE [Brenneria goodwinii]MCG8158116.1 flagellar hook protein FlgE [Brenneria goodwinii]MCG8162457.1 flagellar hook protein FlgE [Brenneria goodwinii]MCG8167167.1 flagellar hook protein FlgE [Brenneria goodwinii]MCG8171827.1 flagellar hook protein FlgE [Brenneria goodwinii]MCG8176541.1 flagellar hook protein FlgE [Brenneria goodwinii]